MKQLVAEVEREYGEQAGALAGSVTTVVRTKIRNRNLFGWRHFIEDVQIDLIGYMISTRFKYSGGAYVACGMQSAIDNCRYCNAQKRRGNYETASLDEFYQMADNTTTESSNQNEAATLVLDIAIKFGDDLAEQLSPFIYGYEKELCKEILSQCKAKEFKTWLKNYTTVATV